MSRHVPAAGRTISIRAWGPFALFTDPHFRADPYSYFMITPSAAKGLLRSLYWKPEFEWEIVVIALVKPVRREVMKVKSLNQARDVRDSGAIRTMQTLSVLTDVEYVITARIVLNDLRAERSLDTYYDEAESRLQKQQFRQPYFGHREYTASCEWLDPARRADWPRPLPITRDLGSMLFDLFPVNLGIAGQGKAPDQFEPVFFRAQLVDGFLRVPESIYAAHRERTMRVRDAVHVRHREVSRVS